MNPEEAIRVGSTFRNMTGIPVTVTNENAETVTVKSPYGSPSTLERSTVKHALKTYRWS